MKKSEIIAAHERDAANMEAMGWHATALRYLGHAVAVASGALDADIRRYHGDDAIDC